MSILTVNHLYILVPSIWCLCHLPSHHSTVCCIHRPAQTSGLRRDWLRGFFFGRLFRYPTQKALPYWANCTDYLISPSSNFFIIITRTIFFYFNLHRDIRATDPSWTFIRGKKLQVRKSIMTIIHSTELVFIWKIFCLFPFVTNSGRDHSA